MPQVEDYPVPPSWEANDEHPASSELEFFDHCRAYVNYLADAQSLTLTEVSYSQGSNFELIMRAALRKPPSDARQVPVLRVVCWGSEGGFAHVCITI
jgi:hypothetical protein